MIEFKSTLKEQPISLLVYGKDGVGKSTLAAHSSRPVFIASECGLSNIDAVGCYPTTWSEVLEAVDTATSMSVCDHIVIDSLDWVEPMVWKHVCDVGDDKGKKNSIEDFGYGRGYVMALNEWRNLLSRLSLARTKGKGIILIAHGVKRTVKNLNGEDYDMYGIKLNEKAAGLIREWVDIVAFAEVEIVAVKLSPHESVKGQATGKRVLRTNPNAAFESKTRFDMPNKIELSWKALNESIKNGSSVQIPTLRKQLSDLLESVGNKELEQRCKTFLDRRGETVASLREAIDNVKQVLEK